MTIRVRAEPPPRTVDAHKRRVKAVTSCGPQPTRGKKEEYNTFVDINEKETGILFAGRPGFYKPKRVSRMGGTKKNKPSIFNDFNPTICGGGPSFQIL
jgi:hypothetical protein